jgi:extracellular elastinolytic metalloproteinase
MAARASAGARATAPQRTDTVSRVLFPTGRGALAAWQTMTRISSDETDVSVVDDATGRVVYRNNITNSDQGVGKAWSFYPSDLVQNGGDVPKTVSFPVWDGSALSGNNAHVYTDVNDDNQADPGDEIPAKRGTSWLGYGAPLNWNNPAQNCNSHHACTWDNTVAYSWQGDLAHNAVQVYSFLNQYHHHLKIKPIGFTEAAGNFQVHNSTGHGLGGDAVQGQASDGANTTGTGFPDMQHFDNANMSTPPDGLAPTMQMYLFFRTGSLPDVVSGNGGNDAEVVYHEYTHGLSNRLVTYPGGGSGLDNQQAGSMGEAWSDWYALDYLNAQQFKPDPPGNGNFIMGQLTFGGDLRSQPVDCPVNASAKVCPGAGTAGPGGYTYGDFGKIRGRPEVHSDGEIWLETLWDLRNALGSRTTEKIVTRGMELSPPSPSYLDMRNAILQADLVANDGANSRAIWNVFSNRGMGYFASTFGGGDVHPVEDFSPPPSCGPCYTISGTVTDKSTGDPAPGVHVGISGLDSGFEGDLSDTTNADGEYHIRHVPPHTYAAVEFGGGGYEPTQVLNVKVKHDLTLDNSVYRDWVALSGGAVLKSFTPPDYAIFCGVAADGAFDLNLGSGWPSDSPNNGESGVTGPRRATVELPQTVNITEFTVTSGGTCGDGPDSGVTDFKFMTKTAGGQWKVAVQDTAIPDGQLRTYAPTGNADNVVAVRFVMLETNGNAQFMDVLEAGVRGGAA